jgi:hypothetical protein
MTAFRHPARRKPKVPTPVRPSRSASAKDPAEPLDGASRGRRDPERGSRFR